MTSRLAVILSQARDGTPEQRRLETQLVEQLSAIPGIELSVVPHLYDLPPAGRAAGNLQAMAGDLVVLSWLYPRAAFWVLDANGLTGRMGVTRFFSKEELESRSHNPKRTKAARTIWCLDLRAADEPRIIVEEVQRILTEAAGGVPTATAGGAPRAIAEPAGPRWYPVIDYDRCTDCLECLNFCLFGVFDVDQQQSLYVEQPDACRPGCPACARICPSGAIMFPAHQEPVIAGHGVGGHEAFKLDLSQLFQGVDGTTLAAAERARALAAQNAGQPAVEPPASAPAPAPPRAKDDLDRLVDGLDELP